MKNLITGGAGFIGSHLAEALLERGEDVHVIDDLSTGSIDNIQHLKGKPGFHYTIETIMNEPITAELIDGADVVYHLAAAVGVKLIVENPVHTIETNIHGTEIVLRLANKKKKKVILASTSEIYGKNSACPFTEDHDIVLGSTKKKRWSYACSKAIDEFLALAYYREKGLPVVIIRFFNVVGPRQIGRYGMVIPTFVKQALMGRTLTVYGDGHQSRTFLHVKDAVDGVIKLAEHKDAVGDVFNLGSEEEIEIGELARLVKETVKSPAEIVFIPYEEAYEEGFEDMQRRVPDVHKATDLVGFKVTRDMREIIRSVVQHFSG
jgi:UDP-glucose 4-epimerase